jgi:hypothetical protein
MYKKYCKVIFMTLFLFVTFVTSAHLIGVKESRVPVCQLVIWVVMLCGHVGRYQCFRETYYVFLQG